VHKPLSVISGKLSGSGTCEGLVNRLTMLVSAEGTWMFEDSVEFRAALGDPQPDYDAAAFAVKNLGFIKFQILDNSIIEIDSIPVTSKSPPCLPFSSSLLHHTSSCFA
jgi:hypothetical protein